MKISLITACFRSAGTLRTALDSVLEQKGVDLDYIVVDGGSDDGTVEQLKEYEVKFAGRMRWISEKDRGMYDAINKGVKMATGDVVGILNADDVLATPYSVPQCSLQIRTPQGSSTGLHSTLFGCSGLRFLL